MQGIADPAQRFVDEVVTIAAMHSTSPESTQRTLRFMAGEMTQAELGARVGVTRQTALLALQFGDGFSNIIYPVSGYFMATIGLAHVPYEKWVKFMTPLFFIWTGMGAVFLVIAQAIQWGPF